MSSESHAGLFSLHLETSTSGLLGAPTLKLDLLVCALTEKVAGCASIFKSVNPSLGFVSHVTGPMIAEIVKRPGLSQIRIDLTGYPTIHWPSAEGPPMAPNLKAVVLLDLDYADGEAHYQYVGQDAWRKATQPIRRID